MKKLAALSFFLFVCQIPALQAEDEAETAPKNIKTVKNFGYNDSGTPALGSTFAAEGVVPSIDTGELIFSCAADYVKSIPNTLGTWLALDYGNGLIGIYGRLAPSGEAEDADSGAKGLIIGRNEPVGEAGISGWSARKGYYFSFYDRKERHWVNPDFLLDENAPPNTILPVIKSVRLKNDGGGAADLSFTRTIKQGRWSIEVNAEGRSEFSLNPLAPRRILCLVNGVESGALALETFTARDGILMVYEDGLVPAKKVYAPFPAFEAASNVWFPRGQVSLEIIAQDSNKNSRSARYVLFVE